MRVLWFSCTPSCYDIISKGGWIESLERIVKLYLPDVQLGIAFEHVDRKFKVEHSGVTYYPINCEYGMVKKIRNKIFSSSRLKYEKLKPAYLKVIQDFKPDIIQCFGSELWHYSLLQKDVDIPFVVHIMGFWNIHNMMSDVFSPTRQMMTEILKIGVPTLVFQLLTSLSIALINRASSNYGDSVIAGMGAVTRITSMGTLVVFGFLKGFQPIAGFSYGAKKFDRLREAIKTSIIWSTSFCLVVGLVMAVFSTQIISQFTKGDTQMILVGQKSLFANGITFILFGFYTVYSSLFLALGKGAAGFFLGACRQGVCFIPVILLLPMVWGMNGILYAQPIADVISVVITVFMALHLHRELSMAEKQVMSNSEM